MESAGYLTLKTEIALPAYVGKTDAEIVTTLNASTIPVDVDPDPVDIWEVLTEVGAWGKIELHSRRAPLGTLGDMAGDNATVGALIELVRAVDQQRLLRWTRPAVQQQWASRLDALRVAGFVTAPQRLRILNLGRGTISRATQLGLPVVTAEDIKTARLV